MADPRFYSVGGPLTLRKLAEISGAEIGGPADLEKLFSDVAPLEVAGPDHVSFLDNIQYAERFARSKAGACLVRPEYSDRAPKDMVLLLSDEPYRGYALVARAFYPAPVPEAGVAASAVVHETARLGDGCRIEDGAVIGAGAELGDGCHVSANAVIGDGVSIGSGTIIGACASLAFCTVGARAIIHAGVRIGQDGFGFALGKEGHLKVPQLGRVVIGDDVEIGANTTIDRGAGPDTVIEDGTKIDNLVQIAHNVRLGRGSVIVSQAGVAGSTVVGEYTMIGGQAGLTGHLTIGAAAKIAGQSGVMRDVGPGESVGGSPAVPMRDWLRRGAVVDQLAKKKDK